ncbi:MAG: hypothetical protein ACRCXZ_09255 [Patescibacteria group bacterium]
MTTGKKDDQNELWSSKFYLDLIVMTLGISIGIAFDSILRTPSILTITIMPIFFFGERVITRYAYMTDFRD